MPQSGEMLPEGRDQADPQRTGTPQNHVSGGNVWPALTSRGHFSRVSFGPSFHRRIEPSSGPNVVHLLASRSLVHLWWSSRAWNLRSSGFCSCVVFGAPSLSLLTSAGAAVPLTSVATTGQLVGGRLGRRGFPLESAAARVCPEAGGRVSVNVRVADLDLLPPGRIGKHPP